MTTGTTTNSHRLRIIAAIAGKDITDALKNKTILSIMIGALLVVLTTQLTSLVAQLNPFDIVFVADENHSEVVRQIAKTGGDLRILPLRAEEELQTEVAASMSPTLGLTIPPGFDDAVASGEPVSLQGTAAHWVKESSISELDAAAEEQFSAAAGVPITIDVTERAYPTDYNASSRASTLANAILLGVVAICVAVLPYLIVEEIESHTMDALLVSPARISDVVIGKTLAGITFGMIVGVILLAANFRVITHWPLAVLGVVAVVLIAVGIGLAIGSFVQNSANIGVAFTPVMIIMLVPGFLGFIGLPTAPWVETLINLIPSVSTTDLVFLSTMRTVPAGRAITDVGITLVWGIAIIAVVIWRLRRRDR